MPHRQDLYLKLAKARQALQQAQSQIVELEAQLFEGQPNHTDLAINESTYYHILDTLVAGCQIIGYDWRYLYINDAAIQHEQQAKEELLGYTMMERHPGIEKMPLFAVLQRCMHERNVERSENEVHYPDGSSAWLELLIQPVPEGIFILSQEITARKRTEQAVLEHEQQFRLFMEHAPAAFAMLDADMRYLLVSHRWLTDYRLTETNVIGRSHYDLFPDLPERWKAIHQRCLAGAVEFSEADQFPRADGSLDWVSWAIHPWRKLDGTIGGLLILSEVITERKRAREQIRKLHRTLGVLSGINQAIVRIRHLPSLCEKACAIAVEKGAFCAAWIGLFDAKIQRIDPIAYAGLADNQLEKLLLPLHSEPFICALRAGERLIYNDIKNDAQWLVGCEEASRLNYRSMITLPLIAAGEIRGSFNLYAGETNFFDEQEMRLIDELAADIAFAIELAEQDEQRQQTEAALRTSEEKYRSLIESAESSIAMFDEHGVLLHANPIAANALSLTQEEAVGRQMSELFPAPVAQSQLYSIQQVIRTGEGIVRETPNFLLGEERWYRTSVQPIRDAFGKVTSALINAVDITRLKRAEADLRNERDSLEQKVAERTADLQAALARVEAILNNSPDVILLAHADLTIQQANSSFKSLFGSEWNEYFGQSLLTLFQPDEANKLSKLQQIAAGQQNGGRIEVRAIRKDGTTFDAELNIGGIPGAGLVCNIRDITERKQAQQTIIASEARYHLLAENIADVIMTFSLDQQITYMSPSCEGLLGYWPEEVEGKSQAEFIHPEDYPQAINRTLRAVAAKEHFYTNQFRLRHKAGHYIWYEARTRIVYNDTGNVVQFISILRDITSRRLAEEALRESEEKFRLLLHAAPIATVISDQAGRISLVNGQAERLFGYKRDELIGSLVELLVPDYARHRHVNNRIMYITAPHVRPMGLGMALYAKHKDGREVPVEIELSYVETRQGIMVMSFILDITERKRAATELEQQRSFLQNVIDVSPSMISVKDYDGRFVLANPSVAKLYNTTIEALVGKTEADFNLTQQEVDDILAADRGVITSGEILFVEERITQPTGRVRWLQTTKVPIVSADGQTKYVLGVATDITERKEAEEALRASEEKYRSLVETMRGGLAVFDPEFRVTYVNDRFCELLGYTSEEVIGEQPMSFIDTADMPFVQTHLERRQGAESTAYELPVRHKDGHQVHLLLSGSPLLDKQGNFNGSLVVATDISLQKQAEATLRQALAKEKELGDLKTRFVSMASHEFRTPLATMLALVETISIYRKKLSEEQIEQRFDKIKAQIGYLTNIMEDVLMLTRMQAQRVEFNPVTLDLDALCRSVLDEFQSQPEFKHRLEYRVSDGIHEVVLDQKLMRQLISNLVSNALKYSPSATPIRMTLAYTADAVTLSVADEGIGIPEADLPHLFEPFHRAANVGTISGTGLGLSIIKEAVELHLGSITVESQVGVGTTFTVTFPLAARA